jgi:hypothetical protein
MGSGTSTLGRMDVNGGGVAVGFFSIDLPPMSLPSATTFIFHETTIPPPVEYVDFSPILVIAPFVTLRSPAKITLTVRNEPDVPLTNVSIYAAKDQFSPFTRVADSSVEGGVVRGSVTELGAFFAGYPKSADQKDCP